MQDVAKDKEKGLTPKKDEKTEPLKYVNFCLISNLRY